MRTPATTEPMPVIEPEQEPADPDLAELIRRARVTGPLTRALVVVVLVALGFLAGALAQQHFGSTGSTTGLPAGFPSGFTARSLPGAATGQTPGQGTNGPTAGGATIGTVKLVDGSTVYVADAQGTITKVLTDGSTKISVAKTGVAGDLTPSNSVIVQGTKNADGTITATQITESGAAGATGFPSGAAPSGGGGNGGP
jgi:hypothetical protein